MTKNMTRKGLAFGAGVSLIASGFAGLPANAAGQDDKTFVSLSPRTGTEYTVLNDQYFDLKSNTIDSLAGTGGKDLKFLVSDPLERVFVDQSQATAASALYDNAVGATNDLDTVVGDGTTTTVTVATDALITGEKIFLYNFSDATAATALNGKLATQASATTATFAAATNANLTPTDGKAESTIGLNSRAAILANAAIDNDLFVAATVTTSIAGKTISGGRATDGTFVINSEENANANDRLLRLVTNSSTTYSVAVTAWVDSNDNGLIDSTEYTSPERTVTFQTPATVTAVTTLTPVVGATSLSASVVTTPTLNGEQVLAQDPLTINASFTRSLSADAVFSEADEGGATQTSVWSDVTKSFTVAVSLDADAADEANTGAGVQLGDAWTDLAAPISGGDNINTMAISTTGVVSIVTVAEHKLISGDKITFALASVAGGNAVDDGYDLGDVTAATVTVTGVSSFTYSMAAAKTKPSTALAALALQNDNDSYTVSTYAGGTQGLVDRVGAETYSATAVIRTGAAAWTAISVAAESGVVAAATASGEVTTLASASIQGLTYDDAANTNAVKVKTGELTVPLTFTALDADGDPLASGRPVVITLSSATADTFKINGKATTDTVLTDANGQATVTVTSLNGRDSSSVRVTGVIENAATVYADLQWADQSFGLADLSTTESAVSVTEARTIQALGSYSMNLAVLDQWYVAPVAATYRLKVTGEGVASQFVTLVDGKATLTVTDTGVFGTTVVTDIALEKMNGTAVAASTAYQITADVVKTFKVVLGANGSTLYGTAADLSDAVAAKALVERDARTSSTAKPVYTNDVLVTGRVMNSATSAGKQGALVTISGPSNILFSNGSVDARGSLTFLSGANGNFEVLAYSTTAQTNSVITVTSNGASSTVKVSFTGTGVGEGTSLVVTMPAAVKPASTFQVKATLQDAYGNAVDTAAGRVKVTYTGAGIVYGTLPTETDSTGGFMFSVLLGSNDTGTVSVTVSYDQNGDGDYVDTKDLVVTGTTAITASGVVASETKVNVGSFKGYVALYAKGYEGQKMSAIVAGKWIVVESLASDFERVVRFTGAGYTITTKIYIDGVQIGSKFTTVTK